MKLRRSADRGYVNHGWFESRHSFSYTGYYDPAYMRYSVLRVINQDKIEPGQGFETHPHKNMEIITYMLKGELRHKDSLGNESILKAGDVQCFTSGTGIEHSEFNTSDVNALRFLQIWVLPECKSLTPNYSIGHFNHEQKQDRLCLIVSDDGRDDSLVIRQDISLFASLLTADMTLEYQLPMGRSAYIQIISGELGIFGQHLSKGDALMLDGPILIDLHSYKSAEFLLFDLPEHSDTELFQ
jgi:quercetin 2,3-dioxygenase